MPNATVRANAPTTPKPKPGSAESIRCQTAELESATALLKAAKAVDAGHGDLRTHQALRGGRLTLVRGFSGC
jgi:hypothetical protein